MPIVVNPGYVWPPETEPVVSPDGRITAIVDPAHAGVLLRADFDDSVPDTPAVPEKVLKVRFERQDGTVVRSGNPAWAPGGYAHAYDHEATLGGGTLWRAVPIRFDGTEGTPSEYVGAVIPALSDGWAWLKPVADPNKAMLLKVEPPDLSYDGRVDTTSIAGSARPAATWDVLEGFTTQLRSLVREKTVADQLMALLGEGPVLAQFPDCAGLPDFYFIRGKVDLEHIHWDGYPWRRYQWDVISIDRPDTTDSPLRIPDLSYDTVERDWTTYDQLKSTVVSYNKLLEP
ncbi:minor tail protein [Brevibacterium phage 4C]|uniref:Minor tail protein n=31 Tax=Agmunavirus AGM1 TaxID=2843882 RepID=A0A7D0GIQ0_9CAUD|nr:tail protein [Brevibacterium phage AGM1]QDH85660.1 minor tail protein [Brevibacterium phage AGM2]QDH85713.1 minor tail protein [Brevibacterium phage AGM3]QDH85766.1 minor tail protein [Brevibacterium phage AGM4]QDH85819.1 minor tail protein [Brevibacterium phage AGM5]QDH85872.1 minor tail protein [Brevibacterium phage AGM6]QDH85925.1 minor tail protein [Brevibacterium phage AGM7]QDH85978.1 minor tail protein [Brevibacterium phage AGM8]QDH86031.1 minor tail protein [Brevibacterium phage A